MSEKISFITSLYNEDLIFVKESIDSMINQDYENFDIYLALDNPKNQLINEFVISTYYAFIVSRKLIYVCNIKNQGLSSTLNNLISICDSQFIARQDGDDISEPNRLSIQIKYMEKFDCPFLSSNVQMIDQNSKIIKNTSLNYFGKLNHLLLFDNIVFHSSVLMNRKKLKNELYYRPYIVASEDYDLWLRISLCKHIMIQTKEMLIKYRQSNNNISSTQSFLQSVSRNLILKLYKSNKILDEVFVKKKFEETYKNPFTITQKKNSEKFRSIYLQKFRNNNKFLGSLKRILSLVYLRPSYIFLLLNRIILIFLSKWLMCYNMILKNFKHFYEIYIMGDL